MTHLATTHIQMLAARWRIFAKALAAAARSVLQPHRGRAAVSADEVEIWVFASIVILNRHIAMLSEQAAGDPETDAALNDLKALAVILLRLAMIIACFKARVERAARHPEAGAHSGAALLKPLSELSASAQAHPGISPPGFFDSS